MAQKSYAEKLKDPRWQRKRLLVLDKAGWLCEMCGDALDLTSSRLPFDGPNNRVMAAFLLAGFAGLAYGQTLEDTDTEDCRTSRAHYKLGAFSREMVSEFIKDEFREKNDGGA